MRQRQRNTRAAFTLIEMLIVIAIIIILMAMLLPAIVRVWGYVDDTRMAYEVKKLAEGCENFKTKHNMYPPARIILRENNNYQTNTGTGITKQEQAEQYSMQCLQSVFNGINLNPYAGPGPGSNLATDLANGLWHDWNGNGQLDTAPMFLEGEEAIVFFLGGMRYGPLTDRTPGRGFHTDVTRPTVQSTGERKGPYHEFDPGRITYEARYVLNAPNHPAGIPGSLGWFPVYLDRYSTPYAYFLARGNTQDNYFHVGSNAVLPGGGQDHPLWLTDCARLTDHNPPLACAGFNYQITVFINYFQHQNQDQSGTVHTTYYAGDRFQIVGAGRDNLFGSGGQYVRDDPEASRFNYMPTIPDPDSGAVPVVTPSPPLPRTRAAMNGNNFTNFVGSKLIR
jgi:competence protein ComGC